jgi:hypothetical protein
MRKLLRLRRVSIFVPAMAVCLIGLPVSGLLSRHLPAREEKLSGLANRAPVVEDWTYRHLIYSAPRSIVQNLELQQQTRYIQQYLRRNFLFRRPIPPRIPRPFRYEDTNELQRDWGIAVGNGFTVGEGNFPAKYVFNANESPSCTADYVVFTTNQTGTGTTDIYAVDNLYVNSAGTGFCAGKTPNVMWAYHVQSESGSANTSPVISLAGNQIAWVEGGGGKAVLHLLKPYTAGPDDGTIATPNTPTASLTAGAYLSCTPAAPSGTTSHACLLNLTFANGDDNTGDAAAISPSSPYYDYSGDMIVVGDDGGNLHEFTNVFKGTPGEVTTGGWPVAMTPVDATPSLASPVIDDTSGNVFVGDATGRMYYVRLTSSSSGTCNATSNGGAPPCVGSTTFTDGNTANTKIAMAPIVDSTTQRLLVFFSPSGGGPGAYVGQDDTTLSAANQVLVSVGTGTTHRLNTGDLDNEYYASDNGAGEGTGWLYVCGNGGTTGATANYAVLERIAMTDGTLGSAVNSTEWVASNASARCDPITEFYDTPNGSSTDAVDYLFFGVEASGATGTACAGNGCVYAVTVTNGTLTVPPATGTGAVNASGGTSGIIVDNDSTSVGAASIYFTWLGNGTTATTYECNGATADDSVCAVKLTQSGLN